MNSVQLQRDSLRILQAIVTGIPIGDITNATIKLRSCNLSGVSIGNFETCFCKLRAVPFSEVTRAFKIYELHSSPTL